jgi:hypothetical protein
MSKLLPKKPIKEICDWRLDSGSIFPSVYLAKFTPDD